MDPLTVLVMAVTVVFMVCGMSGAAFAGYQLVKRLEKRVDDQNEAVGLSLANAKMNFESLSDWTKRSDNRLDTLETIAEMRMADDFDKVLEGQPLNG